MASYVDFFTVCRRLENFRGSEAEEEAVDPVVVGAGTVGPPMEEVMVDTDM